MTGENTVCHKSIKFLKKNADNLMGAARKQDGKESLIFSRNIDKMSPDKNERILLTSFREQATYDN